MDDVQEHHSATEYGVERQCDSSSGRPAETNATNIAPSLSERIELLDGETRSCWGRVDELEDEEASLNHRLMRLEKIRRGERLEILGLEQVCQAAEVAMLQAQEEGADLDAKSQILENLAEDEAEDAAAGNHGASFPASSGTHQDALSASSLPDNGGRVGSNEGKAKPPARCEGFADLVAALSEVPAHENKRQQLASALQQTEDQTRSEIAEAARSAAGFRRMAKQRDAERLPLERETAILRQELAEMTSEEELQARAVRAQQIGEGVERRLHHATNKLTSVRNALAQGPSKHMEEEERTSLELMQGIAGTKARLRSRKDVSDTATWSRSSSINRGGVGSVVGDGRGTSTPGSNPPRLEMQPSKGGMNRANRQSSGRHNSWGAGWS